MKNKIITFLRENTWLADEILDRGWGNGYVVVFKGHPAYGKHYDEIDVDIHGGVTFSESSNDIDWPEITEEMRDGWVIGFDTAHYSDNMERWPKEEVKIETEYLKSQLVKMLKTDKNIFVNFKSYKKY